MTASLLMFPGLLAFWPISTMLLFGLSLLVLLFPSLPVPVPIPWWLYRVHQLQLVSLSLTCSIYFFFRFSSKVRVSISLFAFLKLYTVVSRNVKSTIQQVLFCLFFFFFFALTITRSGCLAEIRWSDCISKSQRILCVSFSRTDSGLHYG